LPWICTLLNCLIFHFSCAGMFIANSVPIVVCIPPLLLY
jgi:hypothetical protein